MKIPKNRPLRDPDWLAELRTRRCLITGLSGSTADPIVAAHIGTLGRGIKSPDNETVPLLNSLHVLGHNSGEASMLRTRASDALIRDVFRAYAREMYREWKND